MLITKRPTPSTVLYTVSTRSQNKTLVSRLATSISLLIRIIAGLLVLTCLLLEYHQTFNNKKNNDNDTADHSPVVDNNHNYNHNNTLQNASQAISNSALGHFLSTTIPRPWRLVSILVTFWFIFRKTHTRESLLVIRGLGVQTTTSSPNYLWTSSTRFIPTKAIQDIFIHEAFEGFKVTYYLSIVIEGEEDVVVVFPVSLPLSSWVCVVTWFCDVSITLTLIENSVEYLTTTRNIGASLERCTSLPIRA